MTDCFSASPYLFNRSPPRGVFVDTITVSTPFLLFAATEKMIAQAGGKVSDLFCKPFRQVLTGSAEALAGTDESSQRWRAFEKVFAAAKTKFLKASRDQATAGVVLDAFDALGQDAEANHEWLLSLSDQIEKLSLVSAEPDVDTLVSLCVAALEVKGVQAPAHDDLINVIRDFIALLRNNVFTEPAYRALTQDPGLWERLKTRYASREHYLAHVIRHFQDLDFAGVPEPKNGQALRIEDVFIGLQSEAEVQPDLRAFKERVRKYQSENERRHVGKKRPEKAVLRLSINQALAENLNVVILGDPGSGKTMFLKYITLAFAENHPERLGLDEKRLPIFIRLYDYAARRAEYADDGLTFVDYFEKFASDHLQLKLSPGFFADALERGDCCVCLDGLDELGAVGLRRELAGAVNALVNRYPRNRYIVASRLIGYEEAPLDRREFAHQTIQPLNADEIKLFIEKWYGACEKDTQMCQVYIAHLAKTILEQERLRSLAANPLILTMMVLVHRIGVELPHERVKLYDKCVTLLIETWDKLPGVKYSLRRRLLEKLAYWMHTQLGVPAIGALESQLRHFLESDPKLQLDEDQVQREVDEFLTLVKTRSGLLVERGAGIYSFSHLTFQEFLAACDIEKRLAHSSDTLWNEIQPRLHDTHWREVILLLLGSLNRFEQHNTELVGRIYRSSDPYESILHRHLFLAARALADHVEVESGLRNAILDDLLTLAASQELAGWDAFAPLGALQGDRRAALGLLALAQNEKTIVGIRLFAAQALGQLGRADDESRILLGLAQDEKVHADVRSTATQALGQLGRTSAIVLNGLLELARDEKVYPYVRSDAAQALGRLGCADPVILKGLLALVRDEKGNERVRRAAAHALGRLKHADQAILGELLALAQDEKVDRGVRSAAAQALGRLEHASETVLSGLLALAQDEKVDQGVRCDAADALGQLGWVDHATHVLLALARDEKVSFWVRSDAASVLGRLGRVDEAADVLLGLVRDENVNARVRSDAADVLGRLGHVDETVLQGLLTLAQDEKVDVRVRSDAAQSLGELGGVNEAAGILLALAEDPKAGFWVRSDAAEALGELGLIDEAAHILLELARDEEANAGARSAAVQALGQSGCADEIVLNGLLGLAQDKKVDAGVRSDAAQSLGQLGCSADETVLSGLLGLVRDEKVDAGVRSGAAQALGQLRRADEAVLNGLLGLVRNEKVDAWVRVDAAQALGQLGRVDEAVLNGLLGLVRNEKMGMSIRNAAYHSLKVLLGEGK
jgi:hypothetical protein